MRHIRVLTLMYLGTLIAPIGCDHAAGSKPAQIAAELNTASLVFERSAQNLGSLDPSKPVNTSFSFRNHGPSEVMIRIESTSCGCLQATLSPSAKIPSKAKGEVKLGLDTSKFTLGGPVEVSASLVTSPDRGHHTLSVFGHVEGFSALSGFPDGAYVIRRSDISSGVTPPLRLAFYVVRPDSNIRIDEISIAANALDRSDPSIHSQLEEAISLDVKTSYRSPPSALVAAQGYHVIVTIPVKLRRPGRSLRGSFEVNYVLNGRFLRQSIPFIVLSG